MKIIKLDPGVNLKKLSLHLPPTLRGKRPRNKEDHDDDDIILKKKRKMTGDIKLRKPTVRLNRVDEDIKLLRQPIVRLNRVAKNPFHAKNKSKSLCKNFPALKRIM